MKVKVKVMLNVKVRQSLGTPITGPEVSRRLTLPDFETIGTLRWQGCQPYTQVAFTPKKSSWYSFLLEAGSTPGP